MLSVIKRLGYINSFIAAAFLWQLIDPIVLYCGTGFTYGWPGLGEFHILNNYKPRVGLGLMPEHFFRHFVFMSPDNKIIIENYEEEDKGKNLWLKGSEEYKHIVGYDKRPDPAAFNFQAMTWDNKINTYRLTHNDQVGYVLTRLKADDKKIDDPHWFDASRCIRPGIGSVTTMAYLLAHLMIIIQLFRYTYRAVKFSLSKLYSYLAQALRMR